jgi:hypothetical protein
MMPGNLYLTRCQILQSDLKDEEKKTSLVLDGAFNIPGKGQK